MSWILWAVTSTSNRSPVTYYSNCGRMWTVFRVFAYRFPSAEAAFAMRRALWLDFQMGKGEPRDYYGVSKVKS